MAEEKKEPWLNWLALSTVVLAVCATLATFKAGGYSTRSVLSQTQASDQWSYFQSKSIKGYLYEMNREKLELDRKSLGAGQAGRSGEYERIISEYDRKIAKYDEEKKQIQAEAKRFERIRDDAQRHGQAFGIAVIFLQIAILLSSIAALLRQKLVWFLGIAIGMGGIVSFVNGFLLFF